jgi:hypothetical protein
MLRPTVPSLVKNGRSGPIAAAMAEPDQISPELALVDPELRAQALETLARVEASRVWAPYAPVRLVKPDVQPFVRRGSPPLLVAASVYLGMGIVQVAFWALIVMGVLALTIAATVLFL